MTRWWLLAAAIVSEVTGSLSLKGALEHPAFYLIVVGGYLLSLVLLAATLRQGMPLGVAYGIWAAAGVAATAIGSAIIFDESLTLVMSIGLAVIMGGVLLVEIGSQRAHAVRAPVDLEST